MNIFTISVLMLINLITLDVLLGLLQRHTRENTYNKTPGLLALLILALTRQHPYLINQKASIRRFFLASCTSIILIIICFYTLKNNKLINLALIPLIFMPFYYLIYGLLGHNLLAVNASIKIFACGLCLLS